MITMTDELDFNLQDTDLPDEELSPGCSGNGEENFTAEVKFSARLDKAVSDCFPEISRSFAAKLISEGKVSLGKKILTSKSEKAKAGDILSVLVPAPCECTALPENIPIDILYEDSDIIVVNKPKGMVVHPAPGNPGGTLVNALLYHCGGELSGINGVIRPGIVHRIDKDTSGVLVAAKNDRSHTVLAEMIKKHNFKRIYKALLIGTPKESEGTVNAPIGRNPSDRKKMTVTKTNSREAVTHYRVLESFKGFSLCEMRLETGRTHQIRVHMAHIGHPVAADPLYSSAGGKNRFGESGQFLHAETLGFVHPSSGKYLEFSAALPEYFENALGILRSEMR